ncbi:MoaD/ThiS family protein [Geobacter argillaceus]|uniref:Molybdopterin converting factor small subunit n=1 Tax=Geobacter argillaceus TaxID=345631 RepID=A0A562VMU0_9BACT|nr:MoaD/ThiS family protein [Geobacter argillaceus]TWJ19112.1 molybdopterin converting factor small subunit [Geobacter argillaceus]
MKVIVKLFASFRTGRFVIEERAYPDGTTVGRVVEELGLPEQELGIMLVNSRHVKLDHQLADNDTLALFPLLGGG